MHKYNDNPLNFAAGVSVRAFLSSTGKQLLDVDVNPVTFIPWFESLPTWNNGWKFLRIVPFTKVNHTATTHFMIEKTPHTAKTPEERAKALPMTIGLTHEEAAFVKNKAEAINATPQEVIRAGLRALARRNNYQ